MSEPTFKPIGNIAALYVRKSNEQRGVSSDETSIARQLDHGRQFIAAKGWTLPDEFVFIDDGVSGGEFETRPGYVALTTTAGKHDSPFQHLVIPDMDRLGRENVETSMTMKSLDEAGVQIWEYMRNARVPLDSPTDVFVMQVRNYANAQQRASIRMHVLDKLTRNAKAGYSTGGKTYGYDTQEIVGPDGKRSHVVKVINLAESRIVCRIFALADAGRGAQGIAKDLNADGIPAPRGGTWATSSVNGILTRPIYKGVGVFGRVEHKNKWGTRKFRIRPESEWLATKAAGPAIVSVEQWDRVAALRATRMAVLLTQGPRGGMLRDGESKYLLTGNARCSCAAPVTVKITKTPRRHEYACFKYQKLGKRAGCDNATHIDIAVVDRAIIAGINDALAVHFNPEKLAARFVAELKRRASTKGATKLRADIARVEKERANYAAAIGKAGTLDVLIAELSKRDQQLKAYRADLDAMTGPRVVHMPSVDVLAKKIAAKLNTFRATLANPESMRALRAQVRGALDGPVEVRALPRIGKPARRHETNTGRFEITGKIRGDRILSAVVGDPPHSDAPGSRSDAMGMIIPFRVTVAAAA